MSKKEVQTEKAPQAIGPYSQAISAGDFIITSGQIPFTTAGKLAGDSIEEQARQSLTNIKNILQEEGLEMDSVVKCTVFLQNMDDFGAMNEIYAEFFEEPYPARSAVEVARLPKDVKIEIEAIALKK